MLLGTEKLLQSEMLVPGADRRIYSITKQIGIVATGLVPDGRALVERAKEECASYQKQFGVPITGKVLADRLAQFMHMNTLYLWARPYGCNLIIAAFNPASGPSLHLIEPSGQVFGYFGCASGKGRQIARNEIDKLNARTLPCSEAAFHMAKMYAVYFDIVDCTNATRK